MQAFAAITLPFDDPAARWVPSCAPGDAGDLSGSAWAPRWPTSYRDRDAGRDGGDGGGDGVDRSAR